MIRLLFILFPSVIFAYLDPGTGSLLLSSLVALFASTIFFLKGFLYKFIPLIGLKANVKRGENDSRYFSKLNLLGNNTANNLNHRLVIYSEGKHYFNVFKPIIDYLDSIRYSYTYFTSSKDDPVFIRGKNNHGHFEYIGDSNQAYFRLNTLKADILLMTTPQLDVLQIKRSKGVKHYCHIIHSLPHVDIYEVFALDYFDSVFTNSPIHTDFIHKVETIRNLKTKQVIITGCTYLDVLQDKLTNLESSDNKYKKYFNDDKEVILLSPSWGRESLLHKYGLDFIMPLACSKFNIIVRPHPQTIISDMPLIDYLQSKTESFDNVKWDINTDNIYAMKEASIMIGDFSGVIFDFICLFDKPVITMQFTFNKLGYDIEDTGEKIWVEDALKDISIVIDDINNIEKVVNDALMLDDRLKINRAKMKELLWKFQGISGEKSANELLKIHKSILENSLGDNLDIHRQILKLNYILEK